MWTPYAELVHHESVTRGHDETPGKLARARQEMAMIRDRWKDVMDDDPCYSPHLTLGAEDFSRAAASRLARLRVA